MIYLLSCETIANGGGIYAYNLDNGTLEKCAYFPCDKPMYAVKTQNGLCVLLRRPFENNDFSGYFFIDNSLQNPSEIKSTKGVVACHLLVDETDVYVANYLSGNVVKNGEIIENRSGNSVNLTRQEMPHTHFVCLTPDDKIAVCDLGTDALALYDKNLKLLSEEKVPQGYGIRHLVFSSDNKFIYAINELVPSISVFSYKEGIAKLLNTIKIQVKNKNANGAGIRINGEFIYVSLREENAILAYKTNGENLTLIQTVDCGGDSPRDFNVFNDTLICLNEKSNSVTLFDLKNGLLYKKEEVIYLNSPLCVL